MSPLTTPKEFFFLRNDFDKFAIVPEKSPQLLIGDRDRKQRDIILDGLEEHCIMGEGHKAVVYGDYGRGKTHQSRNLIYESGSNRRDLPIRPVYVKCIEFKVKEPFTTLFGLMLEGVASDINRIALDYERRTQEGTAKPIAEIIGVDHIARAFATLSHPHPDNVRLALKYLSGEKLSVALLRNVGEGLTGALGSSRDFSAVMRGLAQMYREVDGKILIFFIDEAERLARVSQFDAYQSWTASLRALTELSEIGLVFFVGGKTRDDLPDMLTWDEVSTRIGTSNFRDMLNPGPDDREQWVVELFQTLIKKGPVPEPLLDALSEEDQDATVPAELMAIVAGDTSALRSYPFTPEALEQFISDTEEDQLNKPRAMLKLIQAAAGRAIKLNKRTIDTAILSAVRGEGF